MGILIAKKIKKKQNTRKTGMAHHRKTLEFAMLVKKKMRYNVLRKKGASNRSWQKTLKERNMVQKRRIVNVEDKTQSKQKKGQVKTQVPRGKERDATFPANPDQPLICTVTGKKGEAIVT